MIPPFKTTLVLAGLAAFGMPVAAADDPQGVLSLTADASVDVDQDVIQITFSTSRDGADAQTVQAGLKQALDAALTEARKRAKKGEIEVESGNFSLFPRYSSKGQPSGWQGSAEMRVEGRDLQGIAQLSGRIATMTIARVGYGISPEQRHKTENAVTAQAISSFRQQALEVTKQFGYSGFAIREVSVSTNAPMERASMVKARAMTASADDALPIEPGRAAVSATVNGSVQMLK